MFDPSRPFNDLPLLPPAAELETKDVLKHCIRARTALADLRVAGKLIPDQTVLSSIPLLEANRSSEIENIVTTDDALFRAASLADDNSDPATKEALRHRTALWEAFRALDKRPVSARLAIEICQRVKGTELGLRAIQGTTLRNADTGEVIYTPPDGRERIQDLLANWERFVNEPSDLDPVVKMAVQHYQFEAIHPFQDGNGRTGRILNTLCLIQDDVLDRPILYLSRHILANRADYYRLLGEVTARQSWIPWIVYIVEGVADTANWTAQKIGAIRSLGDASAEHLRTHAPKIYSGELIDLIFSQPYCRIADVVAHGIAKRQAASKYLQALRDLGILWELPRMGDRDKVFVNARYMELLGSNDHKFRPF